MRIHRHVFPLGALIMLLGVTAPGVDAAKPTFERIVVDDEFVDEELSEVCGFEISGHAVGKSPPARWTGSSSPSTPSTCWSR